MALAHDIANQSRTDDIKIDENADFTSLFLSEKTLAGLHKNGFRKPSPIQQQAIPIGKCGFDLVIRSKSGTGKTAVFAVIALEMIDLSQNCIQCVIIAPTREIAVQIQGVIETIGSDYTGLKVHSFIGGLPLSDDTVNLQCCHIAVGAPGRLKHLIESGVLKTDSVKLLVLDEADKLMESSFHDDINCIYYKLPKCFQMIASSATYPNHLDHYISQYMHTPTHIDALNAKTPLLLGLRQFIATVRQTANSMLEKNRLLLKLLSSLTFTQCIVFSNYQTRAESVCNVLNAEGFSSAYISAAQTQPERLAALAKLKSFHCRIILSTDLTARGIDASNVDLVVNYDVPNDVCTYLHRMGRAGRYGSRGICVTLAENGKDLENFKKIIGFLGGTNMSIAKLSNTSDWLADDLWKGDLLKFEQIHSVVKPISNYDDVQKSLLELKQYKTTDRVKSEPTDCANKSLIELKQCTPTDRIKSEPTDCANKALLDLQQCKPTDSIKSEPTDCATLNDNCSINVSQKYSVEEICEFRIDPNIQHKNGTFSKLCNILEPLIQSSNLNEDNVNSILRRNCKLKINHLGLKNSKDIVTKQLPEAGLDISQEESDSGSKRKRTATDNSPSNDLMPKEKKNIHETVEKPEHIFQKNIGVLNVTRLLCDESTEVAEDISANIGLFLNQLKGIPEVKTKTTEDVSKTTQKLIEENVISNSDTDDPDKLFEFALNYAIHENKPHWLEELKEDFDEDAYDASLQQESDLEDYSPSETMECDDTIDEVYNEGEGIDEHYDQDNLYASFKKVLNHNEEVEAAPEPTKKSHIETISVEYPRCSNQASTSNQQEDNVLTMRETRSKRQKINPLLNGIGNDKAEQTILCESKYNRSFMECGEAFLKAYKNYEEFVEFRKFWGSWRTNVEAVRQYAQHKIYTQEMIFNEKFNEEDSD